MSTTTIRLDDELKARLATAAQRAGKTPHAFIVEALAQTVEQAEQDAAFQQLAEDRWASLLANQQSVTWDRAKDWLEARARGEEAVRPSVRTLQR